MSAKILPLVIEVSLSSLADAFDERSRAVLSFREASRVISGWSQNLQAGRRETVDYSIVFEDGVMFKGSTAIRSREQIDFKERVVNVIKTLISQDMQSAGSRIDPKQRSRQLEARAFAEKYDFGASFEDDAPEPSASAYGLH